MATSSSVSAGLRPAGLLPPGLQPHAIASMAPPPSRGRSVLIAASVYLLLGSAGFALSRVVPQVISGHLTQGPPILLDPPSDKVPPVAASLRPAPALRGGGTTPTPEATPSPQPVNQVPDATPAALPTQAQVPGGTTGGTGLSDPALPPGSGRTGSDPGTLGGGGSGPVELSQTQVRILSQVQPIYPLLAKAARIQGDVVLLMTIDATGAPTDVQVASGPPQLHAEALRAARLWRFAPALVDGRAVPAMFRLTIAFRLR